MKTLILKQWKRQIEIFGHNWHLYATPPRLILFLQSLIHAALVLHPYYTSCYTKDNAFTLSLCHCQLTHCTALLSPRQIRQANCELIFCIQFVLSMPRGHCEFFFCMSHSCHTHVTPMSYHILCFLGENSPCHIMSHHVTPIFL